MPIGVMSRCRGEQRYEFSTSAGFVDFALPRVEDFAVFRQGLDGRGGN